MNSLYSSQKKAVSPEEISRSIEPALKPMRDEDETRDLRIIDMTWFGFADNQGFEKRLDLTGVVNSRSRGFVSISEVGVFDGQWKPFQGAASCEIHNVVPHDDGTVIVRGVIGWDHDINVRLSVLVA